MADEHAISDPRFDQDRSDYERPLSDDAFADMFSDVAAATVDAQPSVLDRLQELPTSVRTGLGVGVGTSLGIIVLLLNGLRTDLQDGGIAMVVALVVLVGISVLAIGISLRGLHQRPLYRAVWLLSALSLLVPLVLSAVPGLWPGEVFGPVKPWLSGCFWFGCAVAVSTALSVSLLQRSGEPALWRILTAAGAGGCAGFIVQHLFCPANNLWHLVGSHGFLGLVASLAVFALLWMRRS
jgi:hypothetical protein